MFKSFTVDWKGVLPDRAERNLRTHDLLAVKLATSPDYRIGLEGHAVMLNWDNKAKGEAEQKAILIPLSKARAEAANLVGLLAAMAAGTLLGILFALVTVSFRAPQGIAGNGLHMLGWGTAGTLFRHLVGGVTGVPGIPVAPIPVLFNHNPLVYLALLLVPAAWYLLFRTPWGLKVRAVGTYPRAADTLGINVARVRYQALALGGSMAGLAGAYLSLAQAKLFADDLVAGRGFIAVALVYFGRWQPVGVLGGALLFSLAQSLQLSIQVAGIDFPYEFAVMPP